MGKETGKKKSLKRKSESPRDASPAKESVQSDDDLESVESFSSTSSVTKKRRKTNKTGFPTPKKTGAIKQKKMDDFIVKKGSKSSPVASKRSASSRPVNYSELESDTESLFDSSLMIPVKSLKTA